VNDVIRSVDDGKVTALVLLDLSSAFDTVDHDSLLTVLRDWFAVDVNSALNWFKSYLSGRTQTFIVDGVRSQTAMMDCSVPQGSVLRPLEFISYTEEVAEVSSRHAVSYHMFADDKQLSDSIDVSETGAVISHCQHA